MISYPKMIVGYKKEKKRKKRSVRKKAINIKLWFYEYSVSSVVLWLVVIHN